MKQSVDFLGIFLFCSDTCRYFDVLINFPSYLRLISFEFFPRIVFFTSLTYRRYFAINNIS